MQIIYNLWSIKTCSLSYGKIFEEQEEILFTSSRIYSIYELKNEGYSNIYGIDPDEKSVGILKKMGLGSEKLS